MINKRDSEEGRDGGMGGGVVESLTPLDSVKSVQGSESRRSAMWLREHPLKDHFCPQLNPITTSRIHDLDLPHENQGRVFNMETYVYV
jgi:hypothetical protein